MEKTNAEIREKTRGINNINSSKVVEFFKDSRMLCDMAREKYDLGEDEKALALLLEAEKDGKLAASNLELAADICLNLGLYDECADYWFKYLSTVSPKHFSTAFNGLGACYYVTRRYDLAGYYFNRQLQNDCGDELPYDDYLYNLADEALPIDDSIRIYDRDEEANREILETAREIMEENPEIAEGMLLGISKDSSAYGDACLMLAVCRLREEDFSGAAEHFENALSSEKYYGRAACNLFGIYSYSGEDEKAEKYYNEVKKHAATNALTVAEASDFLDVFKYAGLLSGKRGAAAAYDFAVKLNEIFPAAAEAVYFSAFAAFNVGKYCEAADAFLRYYKITGKPYAEFYRKEALFAANGAGNYKKLDFRYGYPPEEVNKISGKAEKLAKLAKNSLKKRAGEAFEVAECAFCTSDLRLQTICAETVAIIGGARAEKFLKGKLISSSVSDEAKTMLVSLLVELGEDKAAGVAYSGVYSRLQFERAEFGGEKSDLFLDAYAIAFGRLSPFSDEDLCKIKTSAYDVYYKLGRNGNLRKVNDPLTLAAAIALLCGIETGAKREEILDYFAVKPEKLKKLLSLIEAD